MPQTVAAIATPLAPAGLGVVRVSGEEALAVADRVFRAKGRGKRLGDLPGYTALYGHVADAAGEIDDCVALVFRAPHSYTGEDVVEFSCHGGRYLLTRVLQALLEAGAVPAGPGEFTKRAFLHGKMDLTQADAVMDLIGAQGALAARAALSAREGALHRALERVKESLLGVAAQAAAYVDYPDDEIPALRGDTLRATLAEAADELSRLLRTFEAGRVLREGVDTVIVGSPNVGKSTLMNLLAGCERSIVTDTAGTTRDIVEETVRLGNVTLRLSDTAGIRRTEDQVETIGVERARARLRTASLVLAVLDGSRPLTEEDRELLREISGRPAVCLVNKSDCPPAFDPQVVREWAKEVVVISAKTGEGLLALTQAVERLTGVAAIDGSEALLGTVRQRDAVSRCLRCVEEALQAARDGMTPDVITVSVEDAVSVLLELTGERVNEAVVNEVFARFCVGK